MIRKIFSTIKNYKLSNLNFRLLIYVLAVTFIGIFFFFSLYFSIMLWQGGTV